VVTESSLRKLKERVNQKHKQQDIDSFEEKSSSVGISKAQH